MTRVRITLGYDGTGFHGSQVQPGVRTVQGELERALTEVCSRAGRAEFAGRTDRGVHALGQVVSTEVEWQFSTDDLRRALEATTPYDIAIVGVEDVGDGFHARHSACWREYRYRYVSSLARPVLLQRYAWWRRDNLDDELAGAACRYFVGKHGFGSFAGSGKSIELGREELERTVYVCDWREVPGEWPDGDMRHRELRIIASGYLPQMVRNVAAAVYEVARGAKPPEWIEYLLVAGDRSLLGAPAPPEGLVLWRVGYDRVTSADAQKRE